MLLKNDTLSAYPLSFLLKATFFLVSLYAVYKLFYWNKLARRQRHAAASMGCLSPPRMKTKDPLFGLDFLREIYLALLSHSALDYWRSRYIKMGSNTFTAKILLTPIISTMEPANLKCILSTNFKDWAIGEDRRKALSWFLGVGIFLSDGAEWQHSRDMLRPNFARAQLNDPKLFEKHASNLIAAIPKDGETMVDLQPLFFSASLDISTEFLFGRSTAVLDPSTNERGGNQNAEAFVEAFVYCQESLDGRNSSLGMLSLFLPDWLRSNKVKTVHSFVDSLVKQAATSRAAEREDKLDQDQHRYVFLHELLDQTSDHVRIRSELLNILLAGRDTTASFLSNIWYELSRRPGIFSKLQQEISTSLPASTAISFENLKSLKYLQAIMSESLRLFPIVPENTRKATRDTVLPCGGGADGKAPVFVPKGSLAHWSLWAMHRRQDLYGADAEEFRPERWLDEESDSGEKGLRVGWEFLPFNGGPRICIGQQFALTEAAWLTVRLMREFEGIESRDVEGVWKEKTTLSCTGLGGCKVVLKPRK